LRFTPGVDVFIGAYKFLPDSWWEDRFTEIRNVAPQPVDRLKDKFAYRLLTKGKRDRRRWRKVKELINKTWVPAIRANEIDLVHVHFANIGWECLALKRLTGIPYVVSFYGMDYEYIPFNEPAYVERYQTLLQEADGVFCEGAHGKKILIDLYGADPEKVEVIPLGVEVDKIPFYKRNKNKGEIKLVQIASFVEKKGHKYTIQAFAEALKHDPNMNLTLVGKGPLLKEIKQLVFDLDISSKVDFIPFIDYSLLSDFLRDFHVFMHPSCYSVDRDCEGGAPVVLLDAQATGMPVIATKHCDIPAEVIEGKTGRLVEERDVHGLTGAILAFYHMSNTDYQRFAKNASEHVRKAFSIVKNTDLNTTAYNRILKKK